METFDYVIIGAGSAGSVLANRLSEDASSRICVLEAGPTDWHPYIHLPAGFIKTFHMRSRYEECRRSATDGKKLAQEAGDVYIFVLFNVMESTALIHLGQWQRLQRETIAALALAERNANRPAITLCRLTLAWLHVEAMDFHAHCAPCSVQVVNWVWASVLVAAGRPIASARSRADLQSSHLFNC